MKAPSALSQRAQQRLIAEAARRSLGAFHAEGFRMLHGGEAIIPGNHLDAMVHKLEQLARGEIRRLLITIPPRHGKSELTSGSFPAWLLGNDPRTKVTIASYGLDLSTVLLGYARSIVKHPRYNTIFPDIGIRRGQDRNDHFVIANGGSVRAASKAGAMTGLGTHFLIVDDFHKAGETISVIERESAIETFRNTFLNRFDNLNDSRIVIVMQRLHDDDLIGWALRTGEWDHLRLPAIAEQDEDIPLSGGRMWHRKKDEVLAPRIMSREKIYEQRELMGIRNWGAQFQQNPIMAEGGLIDWAWFGQYYDRPERTFFHKVVQSWDPAATDRITSDYSVGQTWGFRDGDWYLLDVVRAQFAFTDLYDRVASWHRQWRADALIIEGASIGISLFDLIKKKAKLPGIIRAPSPGSMSKGDRLAKATVHLKSNNFLLPAQAPWLEEMRPEFVGFPDYRNDDHIDAFSQFVNFAFNANEWVEAEYQKGRRVAIKRKDKRQTRYYDSDVPSTDSWDPD